MKQIERASFESTGNSRAMLKGALNFSTVGALLGAGASAIGSGAVTCIDLSLVSGSDSAGLALLIEWLSIAAAAGTVLRYDNVPVQLVQLAKLSDVEGLLLGKNAGAATTAIPAATPSVH